MTARTYNELFEPALTLTLERELGRNYIVLDATDGNTVYLRSPDLHLCIRFMNAMVVKKEAVVDERSVEWLIDDWSVRVPILDGTELSSSVGAPTVVDGPLMPPILQAPAVTGELAAPADSTRRLRLVL